jgi:hypothetical protein
VHRFDAVGVAAVIDCVEFGGLIADKAFDSDAIIAELNERGAQEFERMGLRADNTGPESFDDPPRRSHHKLTMNVNRP